MSLRSRLRVAAVLAVALASCAVQAQSQAAYMAGKARISAELEADVHACAVHAGNARDVCLAQANAKKEIARAELKYGSSDKPADANRVLKARAEAAYSVAWQKCHAQAGNTRDLCVTQAKAIETRELAAVKAKQKVVDIDPAAAMERRAADDSVTVEKCDALAGETRSNCIALAKTRLGRT